MSLLHDRELRFECRDVSVALGPVGERRTVLEDVSLEVGRGEFVAVMGRSGVGKTTLLRVLGGLLPASPGSVVRCHGRQVTSPPEGVSMVFQDSSRSLLAWRTVARNVALPLEGHVSREERERRVTAALEVVGLRESEDALPSQLSGGMQQRVQIARALVTEPDILLMDEPFGSLDALTTAVLEDELLQVHAATGACIVFVTHDIDEAVYLADRVVVLEGQPATIGLDLPIRAPRPRDQVTTRESAAFLDARRRLHETLLGSTS